MHPLNGDILLSWEWATPLREGLDVSHFDPVHLDFLTDETESDAIRQDGLQIVERPTQL